MTEQAKRCNLDGKETINCVDNLFMQTIEKGVSS